MTTILNYDNINKEEWGSLAKQSSTASPFQTPDYYDFCQKLSFLTPFVFGVSVNSQLKCLISGYIVAEGKGAKHWLSRRAIIHGGVLL